MFVISHRGLLDGPDKNLENHPDQIARALNADFEVEVDLRIKDGKPFLGHDEPQYEVTNLFLYDPRLWIHCKTVEALDYYIENINYSNRFFFHDQDDAVMVSGYIWTYPRRLPLTYNSISVLPELVYSLEDMIDNTSVCAGVCTDYPRLFRKEK